LRAARATQAGPARGAPAPATTLQGKLRTVCDAKSREELPGTVVRTEAGPATTDVCVEEAFAGMGETFDLLEVEYARSSFDDQGAALDATVHFGQNYSNAFWNGQRLVFGDGEPDLFNRFTICLDIIGHELGHGVVGDEAGLQYMNQPGALNESVADVCGSMVKQHHLKQTAAEADWLIGAGLFTKNIQGVALRSMKAPGTAYDDPVLGKDPQPAHMDNYVHTYADNGGVHINSGIPNRAFYLAATQIGGRTAAGAGRVWYEALRDPQLRQNSGFARFAKLTVSHAARVLGTQGERAVRDAWAQVGIKA
jgi:Zn-dependent metalloprotease